jgi:site-specific recombinase XerD
VPIKRCGFRTLRKSVGAHLVMPGVQLSYVAKFLGHKSIRVTEQHYGHLVEDHVAETLRPSIPSFS